MCGLIGCIGSDLKKEDSHAVKMLLHFDTVRGEHSTGVAVVDKENNTNVYKEVGLPQDLYKKYDKEFSKGLLPMEKLKVVIGHNRFATQGEINADNAHPFDMGKVIGAHNGTVTKYSMNTFEGYHFNEMDSKIIYKHLNATKDVQKLWDKADGAMALTWWDKDDQKLHIARNKERTLYYTFSEDGKKMYWASEDWMLWVGMFRSGIKLGDNKIKAIEVDKHYTFSIGENGKIVEESEVLNPFVRTPYIYKNTGIGFGNNHFKANNQDNNNNSSKGRKRKKLHPAEGTISFLLDGWVSVATDNNGIESGYFTACSTDFESVRVIVPVVDEETKIALSRVDNNEYIEWTAYKNLSKYVQDKKSGEWVWVVYYRNVNRTEEFFNSVKKEKSNVVDLNEETSKDFFGNTISKSEWLHLTNGGCKSCTRMPLWANRHSIKWTHQGVFLCERCADREHEAKRKEETTKVGNSELSRKEWESLVNQGCCKCSSPVFWEERDEVLWYKMDTGWEVECPTCLGRTN